MADKKSEGSWFTREIEPIKKGKSWLDNVMQQHVVNPLHNAGFENLGAGIAAGLSQVTDVLVPDTPLEAAIDLGTLGAAKYLKLGKGAKAAAAAKGGSVAADAVKVGNVSADAAKVAPEVVANVSPAARQIDEAVGFSKSLDESADALEAAGKSLETSRVSDQLGSFGSGLDEVFAASKGADDLGELAAKAAKENPGLLSKGIKLGEDAVSKIKSGLKRPTVGKESSILLLDEIIGRGKVSPQDVVEASELPEGSKDSVAGKSGESGRSSARGSVSGLPQGDSANPTPVSSRVEEPAGSPSWDELLARYGTKSKEIDYSALMALSDSWWGSKLAQNYKAPESDDEYNKRMFKAASDVKSRKEDLGIKEREMLARLVESSDNSRRNWEQLKLEREKLVELSKARREENAIRAAAVEVRKSGKANTFEGFMKMPGVKSGLMGIAKESGRPNEAASIGADIWRSAMERGVDPYEMFEYVARNPELGAGPKKREEPGLLSSLFGMGG